MKQIRYEVTVDINAPIDAVTALFVNRQTMPLWEEGLTEIIDTKGKLFEVKSQGRLIFEFNGARMAMDVKVIDADLPSSITIMYEMGLAHNRCRNYFSVISEHTRWTMKVHFRFDDDNTYDRRRFIAKTTAGMIQFKKFAEAQY